LPTTYKMGLLERYEMEKLKNLLSLEVGKDTRDESTLYIYKLVDRISKDDYISISNTLKSHGCYYSKFKKGFICKSELLLDDIKILTSDEKQVKKENPFNVKYNKKILDYISLDDYKLFLKQYADNHYQSSHDYRCGNYKDLESLKETYCIELLLNLENSIKYDYFYNDLKYIREAIIHKSLDLDVNEFRSNGDELKYRAIWDLLPIISGLKLTDETYTSMWGYDQTNVDIAYKLNAKLWGLDILKYHHDYAIVRIKDKRFKHNHRYFSYDNNALETFKQDASQTGQYR